MIYNGSFKDINEKIYNITLTTDAEGEDVALTLGGTPVVITTSSDGLFSPIKSRNATIEIVTKNYHFDLYSPKSREVSVLITDDENNTIFRGYLLPNSYNQDYTYLDTVQLEAVDAISTLKDFKWKSRWDNLTEYLQSYLTTQQILGQNTGAANPNYSTIYTTSQDLTYDILKGGPNPGEVIEAKDYISFFNLIMLLLKDCGYQGDLYIHDAYLKINNKTINELNINNVFEGLYACSSNFYDDDAARTPWNLYEVLSEVLKFMNMTLVPFGDDIYIIDYKYLTNEKSNSTFTKYTDILNITHNISHISLYDNLSIEDIRAAGTPNISIDNIYNKIDVNDNLYTLDKLSPDIFDEDTHISITRELDLDENMWQWTKENYKKFLWWKYDESKEVTGYTFQTVCRLKPDSGWVHHFYKHNSLANNEIDNSGRYITIDGETISLKGLNYYDPDSTSDYNNLSINKYCNTHGCLLSHYAYVKELGPNRIPPTIDWSDILTFFVCDDTTRGLTFNQLQYLEKPVLEYTVDEEINYKPSSGTSWITISGDLFYQYNNAEYEITQGKKKRDQVLTIIDTTGKNYCTCPVDKAVQGLEENKYCSLVRTKNSNLINPIIGARGKYGTGFSCWKMRLQIGDKYWQDRWDSSTNKYITGWTSTPTDFYIRYNNNPEEDADEFIPAFTWMSPCANVTYKDSVGVDGYCIPIDSEDVNAPTFGRMYLTIYTPCLLPDEIKEFFFNNAGSETLEWGELPPVIFAKNFSLGYVYTDKEIWYRQQSNVNTPDKVFSANIDDEHINEFSSIELKINTENKDKPISRSYVATENGYLHSLEHANGTPYNDGDGNTKIEKEQEWNKIDAYLDHHSERKPIYNTPVHGYFAPYTEFNYGRYLLNENYETGISAPYNFLIDSQSWDLLYNKNNIKMIAF